MELEFTADPAAEAPELFIHFDVEGLAAMFKVLESAMRTGHGVLTADACGPHATIAASGSIRAFDRIHVTFDRPGRGRGGKMPN